MLVVTAISWVNEFYLTWQFAKRSINRQSIHYFHNSLSAPIFLSPVFEAHLCTSVLVPRYLSSPITSLFFHLDVFWGVITI